MRIVFVTLFREGFGGGEGRVAHEVAHHFAASHDVVLICPDEQTTLRRAPDGLQILGVKSAGQGNVCVPTLSAKQVRAIFEFLDAFDPDIVHAHEPVSLGLIAQIWARMHRVPFVHTAHVLPSRALGFGAAEAFKVLNGPLTSSIARKGLGDFYANCDAIIGLNRFAVEDIRRFGYRGTVFAIPNGRDLGAYADSQVADIAAPTKVLTFTGFISQRKNQLYLLRVLSYLGPAYELQLVGASIDLKYERLLRDTAAELGLKRIAWLGQVDYASIPPILERTHVFVSASKMEVQSLSVIEALASGTPVVGLANETVRELVDDRVGGCLPANASPAAFAARVREIAELSAPDYARMCGAARDRVRGLDWDRVMPMMVDAYQVLLAAAKPDVDRRKSVADMIAWVPSDEVRQFLLDRLANSSLHLKVEPPQRERLDQLKRVPGRTWAVVGLTVVVSVVGGIVLRPTRLGAHLARVRADAVRWGRQLFSPGTAGDR